MWTSRCEGDADRSWLASARRARPLERSGPVGEDERVAMPVAFERLDGRALVDDARVVEDQRGPRLEHGEAQPFGTVGGEHTRLAALDPLAADKDDGDEVDAVAMRPFGRRPADAVGRVDAE